MHLNIPFKNSLIMMLTTIFHIECHTYARKVDNTFEKYILAVKKLSADFPNHQMELHLDIAGHPQSPRRYNYINLRKPGRLAVRSTRNKNVTDVSNSSSNLPKDPDMQPVYMKDLKKAIEELDRKYSRQTDLNGTPHKPDRDVNMKQILQLLEKGTVVNRNIQKPPEENMSWLQIKIPK